MKLLQLILDIKTFIQYGDLPTGYFIKRGMKVGKNFNRQSGTRLDPSNCWLIEIGDDVIMGNKSQIIAHDFSTMHYTGYAHFGRVVIGNRVFIGANSTILMNVHIGNDVIIGAGSLVNKDIPSNSVVAGVPARIICKTSDYVKKQNDLITRCPRYSKDDTNYAGRIREEKRKEILDAIDECPDRLFYAKFRNYIKKIGNNEVESI